MGESIKKAKDETTKVLLVPEINGRVSNFNHTI